MFDPAALVHPPFHHCVFTSVQHQAAPLPQLSQSVDNSDFVPEPARFPADEHAATMTTPRFTNCCSQRTFVEKKVVWFRHLHISICHVLLHCPARVRFELPVPATAIMLGSALPHWRPILQRSTQFRNLSALGPSACVTRKLDWLFLSLTFPAQSLSDQSRKNASCGS